MVAELLNAAAQGLVLGAAVALAATGLTLIYGVVRVATFAHGDMLTLGAFMGLAAAALWPWLAPATAATALVVAWTLHLRGHASRRTALLLSGLALAALLPAGLYAAAAASALILAAAGVLSERALWAPLQRRGAKMVMLMIASIGLAFILRAIVVYTFGGSIRTYPAPWEVTGELPLPLVLDGPFGLRMTGRQIQVLLLAGVTLVGVLLFLARTTTGRMLRAIADNPSLALVTGIDVPRLTRFTWGLGCALAGVGGVLYATLQSLTPETGWTLLLTLFAAVILGGIGSARGAIVAALLIGVAQELSVVLTAGLDVPLLGPQYKVAVGFLLLILTLLVRPSGLWGVTLR